MIDRPALIAWRSQAPWPNPVQIEQDLLLSRLMIDIARDETLGQELAWWANCLGITGAPFDSYLTLRGVRTLNARGITILLVEQNVAVSLKISATAYVLENGRIVMSGSGEALLHDDRVRQAYMGL